MIIKFIGTIYRVAELFAMLKSRLLSQISKSVLLQRDGTFHLVALPCGSVCCILLTGARTQTHGLVHIGRKNII